ncbi:MAG: TIGR02147 family protein, partial [Deltaproteobacteria bacterium]|nr:TIGR02147 family protein [Deltaproteobacteria bacterium]
QHRDVSTLTLGIRKERLPQLKQKIQEFRKEILKFVSADTEPEEVAQINIQMYPLTRQNIKGEKNETL